MILKLSHYRLPSFIRDNDQLVGKLYMMQNIINDNVESPSIYTHWAYTVSAIIRVFGDCKSI